MIQSQKPQILLTWVSWSWKTTLMETLLRDYPDYFSRPIQYTTRQPRDDKELDIYVFLTRDQFFDKLANGDFAEFTEYNWNLYAVSSIIDTTRSNIFIVEPVGRAALKKHFHLKWIPYRGYFLEIDEETTKQRMINRWDTVGTITKRLEDFRYFSQEIDDKVLDATLPIQRNVDFLAKSVWAL